MWIAIVVPIVVENLTKDVSIRDSYMLLVTVPTPVEKLLFIVVPIVVETLTKDVSIRKCMALVAEPIVMEILLLVVVPIVVNLTKDVSICKNMLLARCAHSDGDPCCSSLCP